MVRLNELASLCVDYAQKYANEAYSVGTKAVKGIVGITAEMCKEVGGLRAVAGAVSSTVGALKLIGVDVEPFEGAAKACETAGKGLGSVHVVQRANEFATGKAFNTGRNSDSRMVYLASRICFLVKDALSFALFLEGLAVVAAGTAKGYFDTFSKWSGITVTPQSISPAFEFVGWGLSAAKNLADFKAEWNEVIDVEGVRRERRWGSLTPERIFSLALDVCKLTAILLASSDVKWQKALRFGALFGVSAVHVGRATHKYLNPPAAPPAAAPPAVIQGPDGAGGQ